MGFFTSRAQETPPQDHSVVPPLRTPRDPAPPLHAPRTPASIMRNSRRKTNETTIGSSVRFGKRQYDDGAESSMSMISTGAQDSSGSGDSVNEGQIDRIIQRSATRKGKVRPTIHDARARLRLSSGSSSSSAPDTPNDAQATMHTPMATFSASTPSPVTAREIMLQYEEDGSMLLDGSISGSIDRAVTSSHARPNLSSSLISHEPNKTFTAKKLNNDEEVSLSFNTLRREAQTLQAEYEAAERDEHRPHLPQYPRHASTDLSSSQPRLSQVRHDPESPFEATPVWKQGRSRATPSTSHAEEDSQESSLFSTAPATQHLSPRLTQKQEDQEPAAIPLPESSAATDLPRGADTDSSLKTTNTPLAESPLRSRSRSGSPAAVNGNSRDTPDIHDLSSAVHPAKERETSGRTSLTPDSSNALSPVNVPPPASFSRPQSRSSLREHASSASEVNPDSEETVQNPQTLKSKQESSIAAEIPLPPSPHPLPAVTTSAPQPENDSTLSDSDYSVRRVDRKVPFASSPLRTVSSQQFSTMSTPRHVRQEPPAPVFSAPPKTVSSPDDFASASGLYGTAESPDPETTSNVSQSMYSAEFHEQRPSNFTNASDTNGSGPMLTPSSGTRSQSSVSPSVRAAEKREETLDLRRRLGKKSLDLQMASLPVSQGDVIETSMAQQDQASKPVQQWYGALRDTDLKPLIGLIAELERAYTFECERQQDDHQAKVNEIQGKVACIEQGLAALRRRCEPSAALRTGISVQLQKEKVTDFVRHLSQSIKVVCEAEKKERAQLEAKLRLANEQVSSMQKDMDMRVAKAWEDGLSGSRSSFQKDIEAAEERVRDACERDFAVRMLRQQEAAELQVKETQEKYQQAQHDLDEARLEAHRKQEDHARALQFERQTQEDLRGRLVEVVGEVEVLRSREDMNLEEAQAQIDQAEQRVSDLQAEVKDWKERFHDELQESREQMMNDQREIEEQYQEEMDHLTREKEEIQGELDEERTYAQRLQQERDEAQQERDEAQQELHEERAHTQHLQQELDSEQQRLAQVQAELSAARSHRSTPEAEQALRNQSRFQEELAQAQIKIERLQRYTADQELEFRKLRKSRSALEHENNKLSCSLTSRVAELNQLKRNNGVRYVVGTPASTNDMPSTLHKFNKRAHALGLGRMEASPSLPRPAARPARDRASYFRPEPTSETESETSEPLEIGGEGFVSSDRPTAVVSQREAQESGALRLPKSLATASVGDPIPSLATPRAILPDKENTFEQTPVPRAIKRRHLRP